MFGKITTLSALIFVLAACKTGVLAIHTPIEHPNTVTYYNEKKLEPSVAEKFATDAEGIYLAVRELLQLPGSRKVRLFIYNYGGTPRWLRGTNSAMIPVVGHMGVHREDIIAYEITHAVLGDAKWGNGLMEEGFATFVGVSISTRLNGRPPGTVKLDEAVRQISQQSGSKVPSLKDLADSRVPFQRGAQPKIGLRSRSQAYAIAGSFVKFLVHQYGVSNVLKVYYSLEYKKHLGKPLDVLDLEWRKSIGLHGEG